MNSPTLSPLPSPSPGLGSKTLTAPSLWSAPPLPYFAEVTPSAPPVCGLPPWPVAGPSLAPLPSAPSLPPLENVSPFRALTDSPSHTKPAPAFRPVPVDVVRPLTSPTPSFATKAPPLATYQEKPATAPEPAPREFTDDDLRDAFGPIVQEAVRNAVYSGENGLDTYLEPMLRATIRRALAEYVPATRPFRPPGMLDRFLWRMQALFTSRTYEDILFEKTHRFQVEEVFLLDSASLALVSYASCDPARHSSPRRIEGTVQRLAIQLRGDAGRIRPTLDLPDRRTAVTREGGFITLVAVVRGRTNELVLADLAFSLRRIEDQFRERFQQATQPLLYEMQPYLEDCLLIQAPATAA